LKKLVFCKRESRMARYSATPVSPLPAVPSLAKESPREHPRWVRPTPVGEGAPKPVPAGNRPRIFNCWSSAATWEETEEQKQSMQPRRVAFKGGKVHTRGRSQPDALLVYQRRPQQANQEWERRPPLPGVDVMSRNSANAPPRVPPPTRRAPGELGEARRANSCPPPATAPKMPLQVVQDNWESRSDGFVEVSHAEPLTDGLDLFWEHFPATPHQMVEILTPHTPVATATTVFSFPSGIRVDRNPELNLLKEKPHFVP